jgi:hypothetical protein
MPEIARFYGIVIRMFSNDHPPPHFHADYGSDRALIEINTLAVIAGKLPPRATGLVMEWASQHQDELKQLWQRAQAHEPLSKIEPLT